MTSVSEIVCNCSEIIVKSHNGSVKLRAKILIFKGNNAFAVCKKCGTEVQVPVSINKNIDHSVSSPPLILRT